MIDERDRSVIEITDKMIAAGVSVLRESGYLQFPDDSSVDLLVLEILQASLPDRSIYDGNYRVRDTN